MNTKKHNITFRLDEETIESIQFLKNETSINLSKLLRTMINDIVEKEKEKRGVKNENRAI